MVRHADGSIACEEGNVMDHESFDRMTRLLGAARTRRAALGALLGAGLAGATLDQAQAKKKRRAKRTAANRRATGSRARSCRQACKSG